MGDPGDDQAMNDELREWIENQIGRRPHPGAVIEIRERDPLRIHILVNRDGDMEVKGSFVPSPDDFENLQAVVVGVYDPGPLSLKKDPINLRRKHF